jgi:hypothetical protein
MLNWCSFLLFRVQFESIMGEQNNDEEDKDRMTSYDFFIIKISK